MSANCPRCETAGAQQVYEGRENGQRIWAVFHCDHCAFSWRDSEPASTIDPRKRPAWAQLKNVDLGKLRRLF
jgi:hypothetical protein